MTGPSIIYHLGVYWWACVDEPLSQVTSYSRPCAWEPPVLPQSLYSPAHPLGLDMYLPAGASWRILELNPRGRLTALTGLISAWDPTP